MLSNQMGRKLNVYVPDYVVFDLETTGVSYKKDRVVEISGLTVIKGKVVKEFSTLVNPQMHISDGATAVNGITDDMVADAPLFDTVLKEFLDFAEDYILVGHNIHNFDMRFICRDAMDYYGETVGNDYIDTLPIARMYLPQLDHHTLEDLAYYYDIDTEGAHRALNDCVMNQKVFENLGKEMENPSVKVKGKICPKCGSLLVPRNGKFGPFYGCTGYPMCKYTKNI